jgi:hypothetical protein
VRLPWLQPTVSQAELLEAMLAATLAALACCCRGWCWVHYELELLQLLSAIGKEGQHTPLVTRLILRLVCVLHSNAPRQG